MVRADLSETVWYSWFDRFAFCGSGRVGSRRGSLSLKGSPSSIGSGGCCRAEDGGGARGGAGGVKARFFIGGSPRFLVDSLLLSMTSNIESRMSSIERGLGRPTSLGAFGMTFEGRNCERPYHLAIPNRISSGFRYTDKPFIRILNADLNLI